MKKLNFVLLFCVCLSFWNCESDEGPEMKENNENFEFKNSLSQLDIFEGDISDLTPKSDFLPYDLNSALFTDYAHKLRFVKLPEGGKATYTPNKTLLFPDQSVLVKNFFYPLDERNLSLGRRIIETRILAKIDGKWEVGVYVWNDEQTEAKLKIIGDTKNVSWINKQGIERSIQYEVPSENDCKVCHKNNELFVPIGPKLRNINKVYDYIDGSMNQINKWQSRGWLDASLDANTIAALPNFADLSKTLDERAKAYIDINCAHCHKPEGHASNTGLYLEFEQDDLAAYGFCKHPVSAGSGSGGLFYDIVPGDAEASILHYRMNSAAVGIAMPELGKTIVHDEGVALIGEWINSLDGDCD